jgi:hypothetical protein
MTSLNGGESHFAPIFDPPAADPIADVFSDLDD